jgi:hypothetical protein
MDSFLPRNRKGDSGAAFSYLNEARSVMRCQFTKWLVLWVIK